jgi:purine-nucleoside phosphorylase
MPIHIYASTDEIAPVLLLPGDPARAERIAERLTDAVCYNRNRGLLGFTGHHRGARVGVQTTMMGAASTAIVAEELAQLGARTLIRVGTAGVLAAGVTPGDLIVATASTPLDGTTSGYLDGRPYAPAASFEVVRALVTAAEIQGYAPRVGMVVTDDVFYRDADRLAPWTDFGALAVEMEASALFTVAARHGLRAGAILTASNYAGAVQDWLAPADLQHAVDRMIAIALDAAVALSRPDA